MLDCRDGILLVIGLALLMRDIPLIHGSRLFQFSLTISLNRLPELNKTISCIFKSTFSVLFGHETEFSVLLIVCTDTFVPAFIRSCPKSLSVIWGFSQLPCNRRFAAVPNGNWSHPEEDGEWERWLTTGLEGGRGKEAHIDCIRDVCNSFACWALTMHLVAIAIARKNGRQLGTYTSGLPLGMWLWGVATGKITYYQFKVSKEEGSLFISSWNTPEW